MSVGGRDGSTRFRWVEALTGDALTEPGCTLAHRLSRFLERKALPELDAERRALAGKAVQAGPIDQKLARTNVPGK